VPLRLRDQVVGVLNVESDRPAAFAEEDRQFAEIFGNHVAVALHILNLLAGERRSVETQVSGSIFAELAGPLSDIVTESSELMEDYIGMDDLRRRLHAIIDRASRARRTIQQFIDAPKTGVLPGAQAPPAEADAVLAGRKVLVADDEELMRQTVRDVLTCHGCVVDEASDGTEAMACIERTCYDLVVTDIKMPGPSGYQVFAAAKAACPTTQVILMTAFGYDPTHSIVRARKEGLSAVLLKPFKVNRLLDECRAALAG
jgi:CheY-like chemotaxis protein